MSESTKTKRQPLTDAEIKNFVELWMNGASRGTISETLQISTHTVSVLASDLRKDGVNLPRRNSGERGKTSRGQFIEELRELVDNHS